MRTQVSSILPDVTGATGARSAAFTLIEHVPSEGWSHLTYSSYVPANCPIQAGRLTVMADSHAPSLSMATKPREGNGQRPSVRQCKRGRHEEEATSSNGGGLTRFSRPGISAGMRRNVEILKEIPVGKPHEGKLHARFGLWLENSPFHRAAFTLIELLVVIAIIAILMAILLPALKVAKEMGRRAVCISNHKQLYTGLANYSNDYSQMLPETNAWSGYRSNNYFGTGFFGNNGYVTYNSPTPPDTLIRAWWGIAKLAPDYMVPSDAFTCPSEQKDQTVKSFKEMYEKVLANPATDYWGSYATNTCVFYENTPSNTAKGRFGMPGRNAANWDPDKSFYGKIDHLTAYIQCFRFKASLDTPSQYSPITHWKKGINCTYIDGHVQWFSTPAYVILNLDSNVLNYGNGYFSQGGTGGLWSYATYMGQK